MAKKIAKSGYDFRVENHGTLFLLRPMSDAGEAWLTEHTDPDNSTWFGPALVVEPRYVEAIVAGAIEDGLEVR